MRSRLTALLAASVALGGCVSVLPEPKTPDALYRIEATGDLVGLRHTVIVREPEAPRLMAGQGIVSEGADGGMRLVPGVEWADSATRQLQLAMIDSFEIGEDANALLPETGVLAEYELATRVKMFGLKGNTAICAMTASLITTRGRDLVDMTEIVTRTNALSDKRRDRALALKQAGADCARQAAEFAVGGQKPKLYAAEVAVPD